MEMITKNSSMERNQHKMVSKKPPLPPKKIGNVKNHIQWKSDEDKAQQNVRLMAQNEKLNLEISELRKLFQRERNEVRELR